MSKKVRRYHATREVYDSTLKQKHTILVYGELAQSNEEKGFILAPITFKKRDKNNITSLDDKYVVLNRQNDLRPTRTFNFGWAICSSDDEFDMQKGVHLAKKRFSDSPMTTTDVRFFSDDMIAAILKNELNFIEQHLEEKYLPDFSNAIGSAENEETTFEIEVDEDNQKNGCDGECKSCADEDCEERKVKETEELPKIKLETKSDNFVRNGDFIIFKDDIGRYGIVKSIKDNIINLYWEFTQYSVGHYAFETNVSYKLDDLHVLSITKKEDLEYSEIYENVSQHIKDVFGYRWNLKNMKLEYLYDLLM